MNDGSPADRRDAYLVLPDDKLLAECSVETYRASGPGGQHRNKTESAVRLTHRPTGVVVTATERRSQHENRRHAVNRLRKAIALEVRAGQGSSSGDTSGDREVAVAGRYGGPATAGKLPPAARIVPPAARTVPPAARTVPPAGALAETIADPHWPRVSQRSDAYLIAAAQVLDRLDAAKGGVAEAAGGMGVSTASLVKFLSLDSDLWQAANRMRAREGLKPLRMT